MRLSGLFGVLSLLTGILLCPLCAGYSDEDNALYQKRNAHIGRHFQLLKDMPIGAKRDSIIAKMLYLKVCHSGVRLDKRHCFHATNGRIDTLDIKIARTWENIWEFPQQIEDLTELKSLTVHADSGDSIYADLSRLKNLTSLKLGGFKLSRLPAELAGLQQLDTLDLKENFLCKQDLDSAVIAWLDGKSFDWRIAAGDSVLIGFVRDLGIMLLRKASIFSSENPILSFDMYNRTENPTENLIRIPGKNWTAMLAKADSQSLFRAIRKITR